MDHNINRLLKVVREALDREMPRLRVEEAGWVPGPRAMGGMRGNLIGKKKRESLWRFFVQGSINRMDPEIQHILVAVGGSPHAVGRDGMPAEWALANFTMPQADRFLQILKSKAKEKRAQKSGDPTP